LNESVNDIVGFAHRFRLDKRAASAQTESFSFNFIFAGHRFGEQCEAEIKLRLGVFRVGLRDFFKQRQSVGYVVFLQQSGDLALISLKFSVCAEFETGKARIETVKTVSKNKNPKRSAVLRVNFIKSPECFE
jgi:hypothetical protein